MKPGNLRLAVAAVTLLMLAVVWPEPAQAQEKKSFSFNVLNQRTLALTAEYWNPILTYVSQKSGVPLSLKLAKNVRDANAAAEQGGYDFMYTNQLFTPERDGLGYQVIARPVGAGIQAQIVVPSDSPARTLQDLQDKEVGFVSLDAFAGYHVTMDALLRANVNVKPSFTGNQEASVAQLKVGKVAAAGVNGLILERYARREGFAYRALWTSSLFPDLCVMAHKRVPPETVAAVRAAFVGMDKDPQGIKILDAAGALVKANSKLGFVAAEDKDYNAYRTFFKSSLVKRSK
jgi:phosphonate transport system substrate-binding protein